MNAFLMRRAAVGAMTNHTITDDGESTEKWAFHEPGFRGSVKQLTHCARCGEIPPARGWNEPRFWGDIGKSTFHLICDQCYENLP
jgi:hypothetical protein